MRATRAVCGLSYGRWPTTWPGGIWAYRTMGLSGGGQDGGDGTPQRGVQQGRQGGREGRRGGSEGSGQPFWQVVFKGVTHCGGGCTLGDLFAEWAVFISAATLAGIALWPEYIADYILAYVLGIAFQYFAIAPMRGLGLKDGLVAAIKADTLSLTAFEIGLFGWMALYSFVFFDHKIHPDSPVARSTGL